MKEAAGLEERVREGNAKKIPFRIVGGKKETKPKRDKMIKLTFQPS